MSNENFLDVLDALDTRVDGLVRALREVRQERDDLASQLEKSREQNRQLSEQVGQSDGNRDEIRSKVQAILKKIESLEA